MSDPDVPLCVDLDGTLIRGDTLFISLRELSRTRSWLLPALPFALLGGRSQFKTFLASHVVPAPLSLPWRANVLDFLRAERTTGRRVILTTGAHERLANAVADHLQLFDAVLATTRTRNLTGAAKLALIRKFLEMRDFDYVGDSMADLPLFQAARRSYLVGPSVRVLALANRVARIEKVFDAD